MDGDAAAAGGPRGDGETRRHEAEVGERPFVKIARGKDPLRRRIVQKLEPHRDALLDIRRHCFPVPAPASPYALKGTMLRARGKFERRNVLGRPVDQHARRLEATQSGLRPLTVKGE